MKEEEKQVNRVRSSSSSTLVATDVALFNLIVVINKQSLKVFSTPQR